ncbi:MAG: LPS export ABC transporter periplasmic protein LptC [Desulfobulbaceae bacterium]|nr:LPS export ABC transporter periplasmic protein LptC [Desulfobulbaceae bacterium]
MLGSRNTVWLLPLAFIMASPLWWAPVTNFLTPRYDFSSLGQASPPASTFLMKDVLLTRFTDGRKELTIEADRVRSEKVDGDLRMEQVDATFFDDNNQVEGRIRGEEGLYEQKKEILTLEHQVSVLLKNGWTMKSESLRYFFKSQKVETEEAVLISSDGIQVRGTGMKYDLASGAFQVGGRVVCDVR